LFNAHLLAAASDCSGRAGLLPAQWVPAHKFSTNTNTETKHREERMTVMQRRRSMSWWTALRLVLVSGIASAFIAVAGPVLLEASAAEHGARQKPSAPYAKPEPAYAKWGKLAVQYVHVCYPKAAVIDYLHVGRRRTGINRAEEVFQLWLREGKQEWGVLVRVQFQVSPERLLSIRCEKV
jgi:hypothetical protein